eukprot:6194621-Pleurochrysis_carterae.AAC.2
MGATLRTETPRTWSFDESDSGVWVRTLRTTLSAFACIATVGTLFADLAGSTERRRSRGALNVGVLVPKEDASHVGCNLFFSFPSPGMRQHERHGSDTSWTGGR